MVCLRRAPPRSDLGVGAKAQKLGLRSPSPCAVAALRNAMQ